MTGKNFRKSKLKNTLAEEYMNKKGPWVMVSASYNVSNYQGSEILKLFINNK